jgi:hypothetical protein
VAEPTREEMLASLTELIAQTVPEDVIEMLQAALDERDEAIRVAAEQRTELDALRGLVDEFCGEREQYITAIKNGPRGRRAEYHRWQGHAEARRQLSERPSREVTS